MPAHSTETQWQFNHSVFFDLVFVDDWVFVLFVDRATRYSVIYSVDNKTFDRLEKAVRRGWLSWAGAMRYIIMDAEKAFAPGGGEASVEGSAEVAAVDTVAEPPATSPPPLSGTSAPSPSKQLSPAPSKQPTPIPSKQATPRIPEGYYHGVSHYQASPPAASLVPYTPFTASAGATFGTGLIDLNSAQAAFERLSAMHQDVANMQTVMGEELVRLSASLGGGARGGASAASYRSSRGRAGSRPYVAGGSSNRAAGQSPGLSPPSSCRPNVASAPGRIGPKVSTPLALASVQEEGEPQPTPSHDWAASARKLLPAWAQPHDPSMTA